MKNPEKIRETEKLYKKLLRDKLISDKRLSLSCPDFSYPEPMYFYVKSVKTEKTIAIRIDGGDNTLRFWDYVDDAYEGEDGVWAKMTDDGLASFVKKLYAVMDSAVDIEYYGSKGLTDDYFAGLCDGPLDAASARLLLKKNCAGIKFLYAKISDFYGEKQFVFDRQGNLIKR